MKCPHCGNELPESLLPAPSLGQLVGGSPESIRNNSRNTCAPIKSGFYTIACIGRGGGDIHKASGAN